MIKTIFWDFDGVLLDSNAIREMGFKVVLSDFPTEQVEELLEFHRLNGGLSRYIKFRYFYEVIRKEQCSEEIIMDLASKFSDSVLEYLLNTKLLIKDTIDFVRENQNKYNMHITSGSDEKELRFICEFLKIDNLFKTINGSPKSKKNIISDLIIEFKYKKKTCILVGDSLNDKDAAFANQIKFIPYNNISLSFEFCF